MEEYFPLPERRYPSPSAQRRSGEHWKARFGLVAVVVLTLLSAGMMFRLAGVGVGIAVSPLRGQAASASRPTAAAADTSGQAPAIQPAAATNPPAAAQPTTGPAAPAAQPTVTAASAAATTPPQPTPTTRPGQTEYVIQSGDTLFAIAQRNNTTVDALVAANNLRSRDVTLNVGQKLIIPAA